jgi:hypothetical protein
MEERLTAKQAKELMRKALLKESEKELQDILKEIKDQASLGSSSIETWISRKTCDWVVRSLEELEFLVTQSSLIESDKNGNATIYYTIEW